ncbi:transposase [Limosilactobacillus reuteri]|uniref:Transposase n=1 Tax=Limosilactobacillus reuteri TaxID=1598 RepID=A0AAW9ZK32_LIMRT|nr:transposase [Limosilactobacillus reuteri]
MSHNDSILNNAKFVYSNGPLESINCKIKTINRLYFRMTDIHF